ncbi:MAG TPA: bifunctional homocysteine S-methyltransferase/methylenetetrahydrofolate reductase [Candidatus Limnocylindrales bacterium]|nr:bifunctional homocysteine S-methyltransferase/methylenetetrahydrofolate reductase [Candidatus Limnocylindrales bacterium]
MPETSGLRPFLSRLQRGPILGDGAMGTQLHARGIPFERCFDELNLSEPGVVEAVHRAYLAAGAEVIETNTFGANRVRLTRYGLESRVRDINFRAVKLAREAREAIGEPAFLAGSVGPIGQHLEPVGRITLREAEAAFREQIEALLEGGADLLVLETFSNLPELLSAVRAARAACDLPVVAQMTFAQDGLTLSAEEPSQVVRALEEAGVDVIGVNCGVGPQVALEVVEAMRPLTRRPLSAQPNAGLPARVEGRFFYFASPSYFGEFARQAVEAGVSYIGGCCGTTPAHIAAMRAALRPSAPRPVTEAVTPAAAPIVVDASPEATPEPTPFARRLQEGRFVISVEIDPPRGLNPLKTIAGARLVKEAGADAINIGDSPMARVRMSALALAVMVRQQVGIDTLIHFTSRDKNLMALQAELIGAHALGVRNIIALTGDPPTVGDYPSATGVWDVDSIGLIKVLHRLNEGYDWLGTSIGRPANFTIACAVNPSAEDLERELTRFRQKIEAGAQVAMSQPLYDRETLERFFERTGPLPIPFLLGVLPLQSARHAEFMHNEVPGIVVPQALRERMRRAGDQGIAEGLAQARELLRETRDLVQGVYLMPSFGRYEMVAELVRELRAGSRVHSEP